MEIETKTKTILYLNEEEKLLIKKCADLCVIDNLLNKCFKDVEISSLIWLKRHL